jgi:hypothetical protein
MRRFRMPASRTDSCQTQPLSACMSCSSRAALFNRKTSSPNPFGLLLITYGLLQPLAAACHPSKARASNLRECDRRLPAHTGRTAVSVPGGVDAAVWKAGAA